jgi:hypothetical protein
MYHVTLSNYRCSSGSVSLTPCVLDQVDADSPQEAAYLIMEHHGLLSVDRAEVTSPDGVTWQRDGMLYKDTYSVALWRTGSRGELPFFDDLFCASSPLVAVLELMQRHKLTYVVRASVRCPDGSMWRKEHIRRERDDVFPMRSLQKEISYE